MRIQHNIPAMNSYRNYMGNSNALAKNLEKLSSGYRINRAGDDAAGLAISEKMRAQISGLDQAQRNVNDGISLVKTAEGALQEVHDMLNRMVTLATQSANGTYDSEVDRANLQKEVDALQTEIDRIADSSNFNGIKLLDGSLDSGKQVSKAELLDAADLAIHGTTTTDPKQAGAATVLHKDAVESGKTSFEIGLDNIKFDFVSSTGQAAITLNIGSQSLVIAASSLTKDMDGEELANLFEVAAGTAGISIGGVTYNVEAKGDKLVFTMSDESAAATTLAASFNGHFAVSVSYTGTATTGALDGSINAGTQNVVEGADAAGEVLASTVIDEFDKASITDGAAMQLGDETYVFALSDKTKNAQYASNVVVVDMTDLAELNKNSGQYELKADEKDASNNVTKDIGKQAMDRLVRAAQSNEMFSVGISGGSSGTTFDITLQEKSSYDGAAELDDEEKFQELIQFSSTGVAAVEDGLEDGKELELQIGDTADEFNRLKVDINDMHVEALGIKGIDISNQESAAAAVDKIRAAINTVSATRGTLGATQNRLEHTNNNLSVMAENIQNAESTIRDTDVADEMTAYTKNNILLQSAQAMLAQANQMPQGVLQLLG